MHRAPCRNRRSNRLVELAQRRSRSAAYSLTLGSDRRLRSHPHDIVNVHIVAIQALRTAIQIKNRRKPRFIHSPEIHEVAVLTELVIISTVIHRRISVTHKHSYTLVS